MIIILDNQTVANFKHTYKLRSQISHKKFQTSKKQNNKTFSKVKNDPMMKNKARFLLNMSKMLKD